MTDLTETVAHGSGEELTESLRADLGKRLRFAELSITHCLDQLPEADVWWRPGEEHNSVGNLVLYVCGAMRQLVISGVGGTADDRRRPAEFAERVRSRRLCSSGKSRTPSRPAGT